MDTAFNIIVIILSSFLLLFLGLGIAVMVLVLKLVKSLRQVVAKGEHFVDNAEDLADTLRRNASAVSLIRMIMKFVNKVK